MNLSVVNPVLKETDGIDDSPIYFWWRLPRAEVLRVESGSEDGARHHEEIGCDRMMSEAGAGAQAAHLWGCRAARLADHPAGGPPADPTGRTPELRLAPGKALLR